MACIAASEARKNLFALIRQVNDDRAPVEIHSRGGDAVLVSRAEWDSIAETLFLMRTPANARWLLDSLEQARRGEVEEHQAPPTELPLAQ